MSGHGWFSNQGRSLQADLFRGHLTLVLVATALAVGSLSAVAWAALRAQAQHNLALLARTAGYAVEAGLVFRDAEATEEALSKLAEAEPVTEIHLFDAQDRPFARWQRAHAPAPSALTHLLGPAPLELPLQREGEALGRIRVHGDGTGMVQFLMTVVAVMGLCVIVTGALSLWLGRRMLAHVTGPLKAMADVAHAARHERDMTRRVPPATLSELRHFGEDFNALLDELALREASLRDENTHLAHRADHDTLTGLPNRAAFMRALETGLALARVHQGKAALLFVDCDRFKTINDTLGHAAGDAVLCEVARRLRAQVRESDTVARLGGDEFALVLPALRDASQARRIADAMEAALQPPIDLPDGRTVCTGISVGIAMYPEHGTSAEALLAQADMAMYQVKSRHKRQEIAA